MPEGDFSRRISTEQQQFLSAADMRKSMPQNNVDRFVASILSKARNEALLGRSSVRIYDRGDHGIKDIHEWGGKADKETVAGAVTLKLRELGYRVSYEPSIDSDPRETIAASMIVSW